VVQRGAVIEVHDCGVGLDDHRLAQAREIASGARLIGLDELGEFPQTGLAVVGLYARRHGFRVDVSESVYGGVRVLVGIPNDLVETVAPAEALMVPPPAAPAEGEDSATPAGDGRPQLARRHSPRHEAAASATAATGPATAAAAPDSAAQDSAAQDSAAQDTAAQDTAAQDTAAQDTAGPAEPPSPEQAGAWMSAFLGGDAGTDDRPGERDNSTEQER
jgi:hypothetical protein